VRLRCIAAFLVVQIGLSEESVRAEELWPLEQVVAALRQRENSLLAVSAVVAKRDAPGPDYQELFRAREEYSRALGRLAGLNQDAISSRADITRLRWRKKTVPSGGIRMCRALPSRVLGILNCEISSRPCGLRQLAGPTTSFPGYRERKDFGMCQPWPESQLRSPRFPVVNRATTEQTGSSTGRFRTNPSCCLADFRVQLANTTTPVPICGWGGRDLCIFGGSSCTLGWFSPVRATAVGQTAAGDAN
jgi:hypothetical protein